jgi:hypothetical protein
MSPDSDEPTLFDLPAPIPTMPYGGGSGWSGSETSKARADFADASGLTADREREALDYILASGADGTTCEEYEIATTLGHGPASAALSRLHHSGLIRRLKLQRGGQQVYVAPENVGGRPTSEFRPNVSRKRVVDLLDQIDDRLRVNDIPGARRIMAIARERYGS